MLTIGMLGGMSWESSAEYYRLVNEFVGDRLGGLRSARCVLVSVDFAEIERLQATGDWDKAAAVLARAARRVEAGGADLLVLCTNTMHKVAAQVQAAATISPARSGRRRRLPGPAGLTWAHCPGPDRQDRAAVHAIIEERAAASDADPGGVR